MEVNFKDVVLTLAIRLVLCLAFCTCWSRSVISIVGKPDLDE